MQPKESISRQIINIRNRLEQRFISIEKELQAELATHSRVFDSVENQLTQSLKSYKKSAHNPPSRGDKFVFEEGLDKTTQKYDTDKDSHIQDLESTIDNLQESLKTMGQERKDLAIAVRKLKEERTSTNLGTFQTGTQPGLNSLQTELARLRAKRKNSTELWSHWHKIYRENKKLLKKSTLRISQYSNELSRTRGELERSSSSIEELGKKVDRVERQRQRIADIWKKWVQSYRTKQASMPNTGQPYDEDSEQVSRLTAELDSAMELIAELRDELHSVSHSPQRPSHL